MALIAASRAEGGLVLFETAMSSSKSDNVTQCLCLLECFLCVIFVLKGCLMGGSLNDVSSIFTDVIRGAVTKKKRENLGTSWG